MPDAPSPILHATFPTAEQELSILTELGQILSSTLELRDTFGKMMQIISDKLNMRRGTLVLLDESTGRLRTEAAVGLTTDEMERGKYALGEGITGNVVATGRPRIVADVRKEPDFLNRTGRFNPATDEGQTSFLCVPIKIEGRTTGALSVDKPFHSDEQLRNDYRFLDIVSAFLSQAIQINRMVMRQKEVLLEENAQLRAQVRDRYRFENIIGDSPAMHEVFATVGQVANSRATVLLLGETGTGKELIAKAIHYNSPRKDKAFVIQNCSAFNDNLLESELFGHVKGSFTGAIKDKKGLFEMADKGTFFLDEIGDTSPTMQVKLLRVLQEGTFIPVGAVESRRVDVRIVAATNRPLKEMVEAGTFREDLYYRLNVINITVPALRDRKEDIPFLAEFFLNKAQAGAAAGSTKKILTKRALEKLYDYAWPGNVRELQNEMERLIVLSGAENKITADMLSPKILELGDKTKVQGARLHGKLKDALEDLERDMIREGLRRTGWNKSKLAKELGISRAGLIMKVEKYGLDKRKIAR